MPARRTTRLIDISRPLSSDTFAFPGDPRVRIDTALDPDRGDPARVSQLAMGSHSGTHLDAPCHLPGLSGPLASIPLDALVGEAIVVRVRRARFDEAAVRALPARMPARLLLSGAPTLTAAAAQALVARGIRLVGTDGHSIDPIDDDTMPAHRVLLTAGVAVLECLDLSGAPSGRCELMALPLRLDEADGSPARAILRVSAAGRRSPSGPSSVSKGSHPRVPSRRRRRAGTRQAR